MEKEIKIEKYYISFNPYCSVNYKLVPEIVSYQNNSGVVNIIDSSDLKGKTDNEFKQHWAYCKDYIEMPKNIYTNQVDKITSGGYLSDASGRKGFIKRKLVDVDVTEDFLLFLAKKRVVSGFDLNDASIVQDSLNKVSASYLADKGIATVLRLYKRPFEFLVRGKELEVLKVCKYEFLSNFAEEIESKANNLSKIYENFRNY